MIFWDMSYNIVAVLDGNPEALYEGIREIPTRKVTLITPEDNTEKDQVRSQLEQFKIPTTVHIIPSLTFESVFETVAKIRRQETDLIINVSTAGKLGSCIAVSAAFVNGVKAFGVVNGEIQFLPVLQFSYYNLLQERKLDILRTLDQDPTCCNSLEELRQKTDMSLPLLSYHINGNASSDGLKTMELVSTEKGDGKIQVTLTTLGRLLARGCV